MDLTQQKAHVARQLLQQMRWSYEALAELYFEVRWDATKTRLFLTLLTSLAQRQPYMLPSFAILTADAQLLSNLILLVFVLLLLTYKQAHAVVHMMLRQNARTSCSEFTQVIVI